MGITGAVYLRAKFDLTYRDERVNVVYEWPRSLERDPSPRVTRTFRNASAGKTFTKAQGVESIHHCRSFVSLGKL